MQFSCEKREHFKASLHFLALRINEPDSEFFSFLNTKKHTILLKNFFVGSMVFGVVFLLVCFLNSSVGLIWLILDASSSRCPSVALCSQDSHHELVSTEATRGAGAGCWVSGKLICILLVTKADHILVKTMCCLINRLHLPVSAWSSASMWSAFVTRCCLFCLEVQGQDKPVNEPFISPILWQKFLGSKIFINIRLRGRHQNFPKIFP